MVVYGVEMSFDMGGNTVKPGRRDIFFFLRESGCWWISFPPILYSVDSVRRANAGDGGKYPEANQRATGEVAPSRPETAPRRP